MGRLPRPVAAVRLELMSSPRRHRPPAKGKRIGSEGAWPTSVALLARSCSSYRTIPSILIEVAS